MIKKLAKRPVTSCDDASLRSLSVPHPLTDFLPARGKERSEELAPVLKELFFFLVHTCVFFFFFFLKNEIIVEAAVYINNRKVTTTARAQSDVSETHLCLSGHVLKVQSAINSHQLGSVLHLQEIKEHKPKLLLRK